MKKYCSPRPQLEIHFGSRANPNKRGFPIHLIWASAILLFLLFGAPALTMASEIWAGPSLTFVKPSGADWTLPANQDRLTPDVWLTRNFTMGLFNAEQESSYTHFSSPVGTEWAYGSLSNYASLTYQSWEAWNGHNPPSMVGRDAVLHLISDDIYLSIKFTSWGVRSGAAGAFSYERSTSIPEPSISLLTGLGLAVIWYTRKCLNKGC